jgi:hypothetical protein
MHNVELHNSYCLSDTGYMENIGRWVRNVACMGLKVVFNRFLIGRRERKGPFRRPV